MVRVARKALLALWIFYRVCGQNNWFMLTLWSYVFQRDFNWIVKLELGLFRLKTWGDVNGSHKWKMVFGCLGKNWTAVFFLFVCFFVFFNNKTNRLDNSGWSFLRCKKKIVIFDPQFSQLLMGLVFSTCLIRVAQKNHLLEKLISPREFVFLLGHKSRKKQNKYFFQNFLAPYGPP